MLYGLNSIKLVWNFYTQHEIRQSTDGNKAKCIFSKGENTITQLMQPQKAQKCYKKLE
jgi:hypothetical protein